LHLLGDPQPVPVGGLVSVRAETAAGSIRGPGGGPGPGARDAGRDRRPRGARLAGAGVRRLRGQYRHYLFGNVELDETVRPRDLDAVMVRQEQVGNAYALHHSMVHAVVAEPYTVSLVVRGSAVKDRFLVMDRKTGESWWQYGAGQESAEDAAKKRMSVERFRELRGLLDKWDAS
jgi:hypothetical protein